MSAGVQPQQEKDQRLRLKRLNLSAASSVVTIGIALLVALAGYLPYTAAATYAAIVAVICAGFYAILRSGANLRFADPSLAVPQLVAAGIAVSYLVYEGGESRPTFMAMYFIAYSFGIFSLNTRGLVFLALFYLACYVSVVGLQYLMQPALTDPHRELFRIAVIATLLGWLSYLGSNVSKLRRHLRGTAEELKLALARAEDLATHDSLTNCFNRRRMLELLALESKRAQRGPTLSVCLLDIDHFKAVNDRNGHLVGDEVLKHFAKVVQDTLRGIDSLARYGGEEFLIVLPLTRLAGAVQVAERARRAVELEIFSALPMGQRVTVSVGVAEHRPSDSVDGTLARADAALYEAKNQGRNRIVCAS